MIIFRILAISLLLLNSDAAYAVYKSSTNGGGSSGGDVSNSTATTAITGAISRTLANHFTDVVNAADWGVVCDGTTDNTAAFQAALNDNRVLNGSGYNKQGYTLMIPDGICVTGPLTQYRQTFLQCTGGSQACELYLKNGSNAPLLSSENFSSLTGTGATFTGPTGPVPSWFGLHGVHLNGNASNQSGGDCIDYYGNMEIVDRETIIENCYQDGIHTEAAPGGAYNGTDWLAEEEGFFNLISRNNGRYGWWDGGPHDQIIESYLSYNNVHYAWYQVASANYAGTAHIVKMHAYADQDGKNFYIGAGGSAQEIYNDFGSMEMAASMDIGSILTTDCGYLNLDCIIIDNTASFFNIGHIDINFASGATGVSGVNILGGGGGGGSIGGIVGSPVSPTGPVTLVTVGAPFITLHGLMLSDLSGTGSTCLALSTSYSVIQGAGFSCYNFIDATYDGGNNIIDFPMYGGTNYLKSGTTFASSDTVASPNNTNGGYFQNGPFTQKVSFYGGAFITLGPVGGGSWIDMPTSGPSGIGTGGVGHNPWLAYVQMAGEYMADANAGDTVVRNATGQAIRLGIDNGAGNANSQIVLTAGVNQLKDHLASGLSYTSTPTCGTGCASVTSGSTDSRGSFTTNASVTGAALSFGTTWASAPYCVITDNSTTAVVDLGTVTTSSLPVNFASSLSSVKINYICIQ